MMNRKATTRMPTAMSRTTKPMRIQPKTPMPSLKLSAITPKNVPQAKEYLRAIEQAYQKTTKLTERDLTSTVKTWDHKVEFEIVEDRSGGDYSLTAGTDDKIYGYVNDGTEPHEITPK